MSDGPPLTPAAAAKVLWQIGQDIDAKTAELIRLRQARAGLDRAKRRAYAESFLSTTGTADYRRQTAEMASDEARFRLEVHDQEMEACKDALKSLRDRSEIGRSINSNLKEELRTFNQSGAA